MPKITKRSVDTLRPDPTGKELYVADSELKGFGVRIMPTGVCSYALRYRTRGGRPRRFVLGRVGTITPDEARALARDKLGEVAKGGDPSAQRKEVRAAKTVSEVCDWYLEGATAGRLLGRKGQAIKPSTLAMDKSRIETHVKPQIGRQSAATLTVKDVERLQVDIASGKTAKARPAKGRTGVATGGKGVAARTIRMLATILETAKRERIISENPARGVKKHAEGKQERFLNPEEIARLGQALREAETENKTAREAIRFLLLTGLRRMEALSLRRAWVDSRTSCLRFTDTKSGAQLRPIGHEAVKLIEAQPIEKASPWVFPASRGDGHFVGLPKFLSRICKRSELAGVTVHVLRHTFSSIATEMGYSELTIAGLLGHSVPGVTARYAHVPDAALVQAANRVSARVAGLLDAQEEGTEVVQLRGKDDQ
jgi:integrase